MKGGEVNGEVCSAFRGHYECGSGGYQPCNRDHELSQQKGAFFVGSEERLP